MTPALLPDEWRGRAPNDREYVALRCPRCGAAMGYLRPGLTWDSCSKCEFLLRQINGIWEALAPERAARFTQFARDYETIRLAEGRISADPSYYLELPFRDVTGRNSDQWLIRSKTFSYLSERIIARESRGLSILDLGAGNGWFSYRMAKAGHFPVAVDLLTNDFDGLGAAAHYEHELHDLFPRFRAELDHLPFAPEQFDLAVFNASFHYSENYLVTLGEALRCLRPGGLVVICDTAWYSRDGSGYEMVREREASFMKRFGFSSSSIASLEFLSDVRLQMLEKTYGIRWQRHSPSYGLKWRLRPIKARLLGRREPSQFYIFTARVPR